MDSISKNLINMGCNVKFVNRNGANPYIEWVKWLLYVPEFEKEKLKKIKNKKADELDIDELKMLLEEKENKNMARIIKKVDKNQASQKENLLVYDYMNNHKISDFMLSKLTKEELEYAKEKITEYTTKLSKDELREKINNDKKSEVYENLSMVDSYILNTLARIDYIRGIQELDERISIACKQNDYMLTKSIENASKRY